VAWAARRFGVALGSGYPGTPSTEILECFSELGGRAQWAPNEKVALEVALGAAFGGAAAIATMKHVGLNVAADVLFTAAYAGTPGPLLVISADDPGMASSQNEQDNRRFAVAAGVPMLEPADSQEAYDFTLAALEISRRWKLPVLLRMTTRVCHSQTVVRPAMPTVTAAAAEFHRDIAGHVMIPLYARPAHRRLRQKLAEIAQWNETSSLNRLLDTTAAPPAGHAAAAPAPLGIVTSGVATMHVREAAPEARVLKLGLTWPLPLEKIAQFARGVERCLVIEEGDPVLVEQLRTAGIAVEGKPEMYRFGELNVARVRRILAGDTSPEAAPLPGKPPALCIACPHRSTFAALQKLDCIVAGDIGCYSLGVLPPLEGMDSLVCMGASIGMGLGLRHVLPAEQARRVVSVIGDSTFVHSGITGLVEMVYNPPPGGHVVLILDNGTTAMTGLQEHPGTGRTLDNQPTGRVDFEALARSLGIVNVHTIDPAADGERFEHLLCTSLASGELTVIIARRPCLLATIRKKGVGSRFPGATAGLSSSAEPPPNETLLDKPAVAPLGAKTTSDPFFNVVLAGLGGQGVLKASDILAEAAFLAGLDVKKAEVHGMSQRGGSVTTDVRFGPQIFSPMVPPGEADFLVVLAEDQVDNNRPRLRPGGRLIAPLAIDPDVLPQRRTMNLALLGVLSRHLAIDPAHWHQAIRKHLKAEFHDINLQAFEIGRRLPEAPSHHES
jgi:indolepyruvate ferredoxin oxidoreductase alpha subunit